MQRGCRHPGGAGLQTPKQRRFHDRRELRGEHRVIHSPSQRGIRMSIECATHEGPRTESARRSRRCSPVSGGSQYGAIHTLAGTRPARGDASRRYSAAGPELRSTAARHQMRNTIAVFVSTAVDKIAQTSGLSSVRRKKSLAQVAGPRASPYAGANEREPQPRWTHRRGHVPVRET